MNLTANPDIYPLINVLNHFYPLSEPIVDYLNKHVIPVKAPKGEALVEAGSVCEHVYFIIKGAIRGYIVDNGKDITTWISAENELVTSIYSLDTDDPAPENIETLEDCELLVMTTDALKQLYLVHKDFNIIGRKLLQKYYRDAESRAFIIRVSRAEDKYERFLQLYSHLANRVLLKYIASFLGITLETLSRIRSRYAMRGKPVKV
jgi:CRP-like cAMP-binding protein